MPKHLESIYIGSLDTINELSTYIRNKGNNYEAASQPNLERCVAGDVGEKIIPLSKAAIPKLYQNVGLSSPLLE